jgi:hypothetical protein
MTTYKEITLGMEFPTKNNGKFKIVSKIGGDRQELLIEFVDTGYRKVIQYRHIAGGSIKDKLRPSRFGVGFEGDGVYKFTDSHRCLIAWKHMLERCYCPKFKEKNPAYAEATMDSEWHNFQNFAKWFHETYPQDGLMYELDKDFKCGGKHYSEGTCSWLSQAENKRVSKQKLYKFRDPDGNYVEVLNLTQFCSDKDLIRELMGKVYNGKRKRHKSWTKAD